MPSAEGDLIDPVSDAPDFDESYIPAGTIPMAGMREQEQSVSLRKRPALGRNWSFPQQGAGNLRLFSKLNSGTLVKSPNFCTFIIPDLIARRLD